MRKSARSSSLLILCAALFARVAVAASDPSSAPPGAAPAARPAADVNPDAPIIPSATINLSDFGGIGDGKTYNTDAFNRAIHAIDQAGGGRLIVSPGVYLTRPFHLASHMDLHLESGATIQFPDDVTAYGLPDPAHMNSPDITTLRDQDVMAMEEKVQPLIGGDGLSDVAITGPGAIDGGGSIWWSYSDRVAKHVPGRPWYPRPVLIDIRNSRRLLVQDVTLRNSPMYNFAPTNCSDVRVQNVRTQEPNDSPNTDGIDPTACDRVLIKDCHLEDGDDSIAIKATGGKCSNVLVEGCTCRNGHGISIGSETYGGIENVFVRNCTFDQSKWAIRIKSARDRGNLISGFTFDNITMTNVGMPIDIDMFYHDIKGAKARSAAPITPTTPLLRDVLISNVTVTGAQDISQIIGLPERPVEGITLQNVQLDGKRGFVLRDAANITFNHVAITAQQGSLLSCENTGLTWNP
jgi:polygalacturonase